MSSISGSGDLWSGDPQELKTKTIESFIETIEDTIADLNNDEDVKRWEERKSELVPAL